MKQTIKTNERELASKVTEWFNEVLRTGNYPFTEATNETGIQVESKTYFGDIVVWKNRQSNEAFSYLELKPPFTEKENLERFKKKAFQLNVQYAYTWDFQALQLFHFKKNTFSLIHSESTPILSIIDEWLRGDKQATIKTYIRRICDDLLHFSQSGKPIKFIPDKVFFVNLIRETTQQLLPLFEEHLRQKQQSKTHHQTLRAYWRKQGIPEAENYLRVLAHHFVYGLVTKIIFYLTIRRYFQDLPELYHSDETDLNKLIRTAFAFARERDWQAVFEEDPVEELGIPKSSYEILQHLFSELRAYHFGELSEDVLGQLFEEIIDPEKRHSLGQYFTREDLVDFVLSAVVKTSDGTYCDPTCGSGTFLIRLYDRLRFLSSNRLTHEERLNKIWGFDIGKFPAELSTINLFRQDVSNIENFPRVRRTDIFEVRKGDTFEFPPPNSRNSTIKVQLELPEFNALVGNFPYIRQELIEKEAKGYKEKLTKLLAEEYSQTHPRLFHFKSIVKEEVATPKAIENAIKHKQLELSLSGQADIYAYIFLHATTMLKENGEFAIITSNSWLDVSYGTVLKNFFLENFKIKMVVASWAEPWFEDAAVNTIVTVLEKENDETKRNENLVHFVKLKKKLEDLNSFNMKFERDKRWQKWDALVNTIEEAQYHRGCGKVTDDISSLETDELRVRMISQNALKKELEQQQDFAKWGKYLRAPDVYFEIIEKCKEKLVPLKKIADVRRGYTTGVNDFFYLEPLEIVERPKAEMKLGRVSEPPSEYLKPNLYVHCRNARGWEGIIESKFLKKIIKSPKEAESITIDSEKLKYFIFICNKSKSELRKDGDIYALKYIEWGETQRTEEKQNVRAGMLWSEVPTVHSRKYWWSILPNELSDMFWFKAFNDRFIVLENSNVLSADRLYEITFHDKSIKEKVSSLLNSTLQFLFVEINGRVNLGEGALDNMTYEAEQCFVLNPDKVNLKKVNRKLFSRNAESIFEEVKQKDRIALDTAVLEALGLNAKEYLPRLYDGLCEMVRERLELPKMRKKQQKETYRVAYEQVKKSVIDDCLPYGVRKFPDDFLGVELQEKDFETFATSGKPLSYHQFFQHYEIKDGTGQKICTLDSESKAEFAVLLAKQNVYSLTIPKEEKIVKKVLQAYRKYVKELKTQLEADANQKLHDWAISERMTKEILIEYGIE